MHRGMMSALALLGFLAGCGSRTPLFSEAARTDVPPEDELVTGGTLASGGAPASGGRASTGGQTTGGASTGGVGSDSATGGQGTGAQASGGDGGQSSGGQGSGGQSSGGQGSGGQGSGGAPPTLKRLEPSSSFTCALLSNGSVRCWGLGTSGVLGYGDVETIGDDEIPSAAGDVELGGAAVDLAAGYYSVCALLDTGSVRCWGTGPNGQLGYGNLNMIGDDETPASAGDVELGMSVVALSAGRDHVCALSDDGRVRCWGRGGALLGYGHSAHIGDNETPSSAGDVPIGQGVVQVACGHAHTCALLESGAVRCWGSAQNGQLGSGNLENIGDNETPDTAPDVELGAAAVQIAAGGHHTCALLETGGVRCFGYGAYGALGYGDNVTIGDDEVPASVGEVDIGGEVARIIAGERHTCALLENGALRCWGFAELGRLGYGNIQRIGDDEPPADAGDVPLGEPAVEVDASAHTCAVLASGAAKCWGGNIWYQLGLADNLEDIGDDETPAETPPIQILDSFDPDAGP